MDADTRNSKALRQVQALEAALRNLPTMAAEVYAKGALSRKPIVDRHFTAGNHQRHGWQPLSQAYAARKAGQAGALRGQMRKAGRTVSKLDPAVPFQSRTGDLVGFGASANLPMLVRTGKLRQAVVSPTLHRIAQSGDVARVTFSGLPDYAVYLHEGTAKMPKRSPVDPSPEDMVEVADHLRRYLDGITGGGGHLQRTSGFIPGAARVAR